jgi:hypothetical protein
MHFTHSHLLKWKWQTLLGNGSSQDVLADAMSGADDSALRHQMISLWTIKSLPRVRRHGMMIVR